MDRKDRISALLDALQSRVLVIDGAMGTAVQEQHLTAEAFGGPQYEGCNEHLVLTRPSAIRTIHEAYLAAGADILETDTFGATPLVLAEYGLEQEAHAINVAAARLAREAADRHATPDRPRFVAGSIGPTTKAMSVTGGVSFPDLVEHYLVQMRGLHEGGVDYLLVETSQDTRNVKAALVAAERLFEEGRERIPVAVSGTIEAMGTMLAGQSIEALVASLEHVDLLYLGLNCATGPQFMTDHLRSLAAAARTRVACVPNAGLPDEEGRYLESPEMVARALERFGQEGWLNLVGGCCGTTAAHIAALAEVAPRIRPRTPSAQRRSVLSGVDLLEVTEEVRPVIVGERTNVLGSKRFRDLIAQEKWEEAAEVARVQVKKGAQIIDVSCQQTDRDEVADLRCFLERAVQKVRVPLMIDSTNERAVAEALTWCQGKAIINSVNLEDGEKRFERIVPLARRFGAALVVGSIDERGQAIPAAQKIEVAQRSHELLTKKYGVAEEDLYFDPLVFPAASGDVHYTGAAMQTIEAVRGIKQALPRSKTVLGISNVSFGLPPAGREVVNSVFLYHCVQAGLDLAIVNAEKLERYPSIPEEERILAEDVLFCRGAGATDDERLKGAIARFAEHFREKKPKAAPLSALSLDERLARYIVEGAKEGLAEDIAEKLKTTRPLDIINGPLMKGMDEVGRLFNANELIVAEVLQSAEAMKAAVGLLEPHMERADAATRGKVLLATVKGDVHDIGKNLVDIVLSNNGFAVVNLGTKVAPEKLIEAVREHDPDLIGLSGLLVKSAQQMVVTAADLARVGVEVPMLVGGAALSRAFTDKSIAPAYKGTVAHATDAMNGLELAKQIVDPAKHAQLRSELQDRRSRLAKAPVKAAPASISTSRSREVEPLAEVPRPPDLDRHSLVHTPLDFVWKYVNPVMLYGRHLGVKSSLVRSLDTMSRADLSRTEAGRRSLEVRDAVDQVKEECRKLELMKVGAVYRFFRARSEGNALHLFLPGEEKQAASFAFSRQPRPDGLCLADYVAGTGGPEDNVCLFVTTAGRGIRERADACKAKGEYLKSHILHALALETAEGYAEMLHSLLRSMWGFPDEPAMTMQQRFKADYRGKRYSFGYPACPRLEDQEALFRLLAPQDIGVELTEGWMMDPEASVSALVFHHPQATYFSVADLGA
ncbi:MAG: methionine synthase [Deltaproteobacteria bacterium]|nr:methionine synthase [Deltaproteobacteria bacterium]